MGPCTMDYRRKNKQPIYQEGVSPVQNQQFWYVHHFQSKDFMVWGLDRLFFWNEDDPTQ